MIESFLSVGTQVLILFLMIGTGFVLGKLHLITHKGAVSMSNLLMYVVSPCILIVVFQRPLETETFHNFLLPDFRRVKMNPRHQYSGQ